MHGCLPNSGSRRATGLGHQYGADVQGDGLVSKTDRQGAIPWRRANLPPVAQTVEQTLDKRQRPVQVRTGGPFFPQRVRKPTGARPFLAYRSNGLRILSEVRPI